jgi:hypothetical protein
MPDVMQDLDGLQLVSTKGIRRMVVQQWSLPVHGVADIAGGEPHVADARDPYGTAEASSPIHARPARVSMPT